MYKFSENIDKEKRRDKHAKAGGMTENFAVFKMTKKTVIPPALNVFQTL